MINMRALERTPTIVLPTASIPNQVTTKPKLSMVWVTQSDNGRQYLVAKWVKQD